MKILAAAIGVAVFCLAASAQQTANFEGLNASSGGTILTGQDGWYLPAAGGLDHMVFTYAGNTFGFPQNPTGGTKFEVGSSGSNSARAQHDYNFSTSGAWRISWDIAAKYTGTLPSAPNLGSFSLQDSATARYFQSMYNWMDVSTTTAWRVQFLSWSCDGFTSTTASPSAAFDNLVPNRWYRCSVLFSFTENRIHEISITDLSTNQTSTATPSGWYLIGGRNSTSRPLPTAIRHFAGGASGNTVATDNLVIQAVTEPPVAGPCPAPGSDLCATATAVGEGTFPFTLASATGDGYATCTNQFGTPDVWFRYTPTQTGTAVINTCESGLAGLDTVISVFDICPSLGGSEFYCADDGCNSYWVGSRIEVPVLAGLPWLVRVSNRNGLPTGTGNLDIHMRSPPPNDSCSSATSVGEGTHAFTLRDSTNDGGTGPSCTTQINTAPEDVWLRYTPTATGTATATMCGISAFDSVIAAYDTCGGTQLACSDDNCGVGGGPSSITFPATVGQPVRIRITEWEGGAYSSGSIQISIAPVVVAFCSGDGTGIPCPCGNSGAAGNGCANSGFPGGANLAATGTARVSADTLVLNASSMTGTSAVFFQGGSQIAPVVIDDGIGCVGGPIVRLGNKPAAGTSSYPQAGDPSISVRGSIPAAGGTYYYQCFYRNAAAAFCPPATSNRTNGLRIVWAP